MKKMFLVTLLLAFAGIGFAEMPKIVNPPRPTKQYKYLISARKKIQRPQEMGYQSVYIYANQFKFVKYKRGFFSDSITTMGSSDVCIVFHDSIDEPECLVFKYGQSIGVNQQDHSGNVNFLHFYPLTSFILVARVPKLVDYPYYNSPKPTMGYDPELEMSHLANPRKIQKAKVVFTK